MLLQSRAAFTDLVGSLTIMPDIMALSVGLDEVTFLRVAYDTAAAR